jgi:hypothetical protein
MNGVLVLKATNMGAHSGLSIKYAKHSKARWNWELGRSPQLGQPNVPNKLRLDRHADIHNFSKWS